MSKGIKAGYINIKNGYQEPSSWVSFDSSAGYSATIVNDPPTGINGWDKKYQNDNYAVVWNEFEDGTLVSKWYPECAPNEAKTQDWRGYDTNCSITGTINYGGKSYSVRFMTAGYCEYNESDRAYTGDPVYGPSAGDADEFYKYFHDVDDKTSATWGSYMTFGMIGAKAGNYAAFPLRDIPGLHGADENCFVRVHNTKSSSGKMDDNATIRLMGIPAHHYAYAEGVPDDLGMVFDPFSFKATFKYDDQDTISSVTAKCDGETFYSESNVQSGSTKSIGVSEEFFSGISDGSHTITLDVTQETGLTRSYETAFVKKYVYIEAESSAFQTPDKPVACSIAKAVVVGQGATEKWWVCNNANDDSPAWEEYSGDVHSFENSTSSSGTWAVAWKCKIGGATATTRSELLKQVAMGVSYEIV